jgi:hypothetical protein
MRNKRLTDRNTFGYGMGFPLMLVFYVVLALMTFSMISLMTAKHSYSNECASVESYTEYNEAANQAEEWIGTLRAEDSTILGKVYTEEFKISDTKKLMVSAKFWDNSIKIVDWRIVVTKNSEEQTVKGL